MRGSGRQYDERESRGGGDNAGDNAGDNTGGRRLLAAAPDNGGGLRRPQGSPATHMWVHRRWLDMACSGVGERQS